MDIKELKLLGAFNHPNIVRFVSLLFSFCLLHLTVINHLAWGEYTREHQGHPGYDCQRTVLEWRPFRLRSKRERSFPTQSRTSRLYFPLYDLCLNIL